MNPIEKALAINRDGTRYGTFAEIGAGQEVARYFFQAGLASHTVAKTMSAYDMTFSDAIYGREANGRYVCEPRLHKMLSHEYTLLWERLNEKRADKTCFFVFADTIATQSGAEKNNHGWLGIRFQTMPKGPANDFIIHVRLNDSYRLMQQEALGTLGVNLIYGATYKHDNISDFISTLTDNLKKGRIDVDMIRSQGPQLSQINQYQLSLELLRQGLTPAVLFLADGKPAQPSEAFYKHSLLVKQQRLDDFIQSDHESLAWEESLVKHTNPSNSQGLVKLIEVSLHGHEESSSQFQKVIPAIQRYTSHGQAVLVSLFSRTMDLKCFLQRHTDQQINFKLDSENLKDTLNTKTYQDLEGKFLEGIGKLTGSGNSHFFIDKTPPESFFETPDEKKIFGMLCDAKKIIVLG